MATLPVHAVDPFSCRFTLVIPESDIHKVCSCTMKPVAVGDSMCTAILFHALIAFENASFINLTSSSVGGMCCSSLLEIHVLYCRIASHGRQRCMYVYIFVS